MPEGDTIWRLSERLQPLVGRVITHSDFRIAPLATASLTGERIDRICRTASTSTGSVASASCTRTC